MTCPKTLWAGAFCPIDRKGPEKDRNIEDKSILRGLLPEDLPTGDLPYRARFGTATFTRSPRHTGAKAVV